MTDVPLESVEGMLHNIQLHSIIVEKQYYDSGGLFCERQMIDGKRHGITTFYNHAGEIYNISQYANDKFVACVFTT
jgi:antitoxin component YwqK of YwqJK toxin-antitoxin module